jgi:transposase
MRITPCPVIFGALLARLLEHFKLLTERVEETGESIRAWHRSSDLSKRLETIPGIGPLTASALAATIGNAKNFDNGRQLAAWLGLVPRQHSSGGKPTLLGMSKRGDAYLRTLLIHGARAVVYHTRHSNNRQSWLTRLIDRKNVNIAAVALANKNARIAWALLAHDRAFCAGYTLVRIAA